MKCSGCCHFKLTDSYDFGLCKNTITISQINIGDKKSELLIAQNFGCINFTSIERHKQRVLTQKMRREKKKNGKIQ